MIAGNPVRLTWNKGIRGRFAIKMRKMVFVFRKGWNSKLEWKCSLDHFWFSAGGILILFLIRKKLIDMIDFDTFDISAKFHSESLLDPSSSLGPDRAIRSITKNELKESWKLIEKGSFYHDWYPYQLNINIFFQYCNLSFRFAFIRYNTTGESTTGWKNV